MDFFEAQEQAIGRSRRLVLWFSLCVAAVVVVLYFAAVFLRPFVTGPVPGKGWWDPELAMVVAPAAAGVIVLGSLFKLIQLSAGGSVVARDLGGRQVEPSTTDPLERRLLNVVEEMSIASGLAAPQVWVLDGEEGINAFAAGTDPSNAVIGVTKGCLERLNREELQGVVAHEFSHILNGDMRLNLRLMGWIFGLVMIAMLGRMLMETIRYSRSSSRDSKGGGIILAVLAAGLAMWLVGSIGVFFARLLQAAVSRQREYLADAAAVQFTRHPEGLANALKKVGGLWRNGALQTAKAAEARHLFFVKSDLLALGFATHPPLKDRIKAIDPSWDGEMVKSVPEEVFEDGGSDPRSSMLVPATAAFALETLGESGRLDPRVGEVIRRQLAERNVVFRSKAEAKALLYGLLLAQDPVDHENTFRLLSKRKGGAMAEHAAVWSRELTGRTAAEKLALVDLSLPWLRRMGREEAEEFLGVTRDLIAEDGHVSLFEFMLQKVMERQIVVGLGLRAVARIRYRTLDSLAKEAAVLTGAFAAVSKDPAALEAGRAEFEAHAGRKLEVPEERDCSLQEVARALEEFEAATPLVKVQILRICALVATHDGFLEDGEIELLRAAAEAIGAPVPPLARAANV